jgi:hypothetical protein
VIRLGRAANAVRFCQYILLKRQQESTPSVQRERLNAFLYVCAVLFEGMEAAKKASKDLKMFKAFQEKFVPLFRDPSVQTLLTETLKPVRNQGVFHFSDDAIPSHLDGLSESSVTLVAGRGPAAGDSYVALADVALLYGALGVSGTLDEVYHQLRPLLKDVADLSARFGDAYEDLMAEVVGADAGWQMIGDPNGGGTGV